MQLGRLLPGIQNRSSVRKSNSEPRTEIKKFLKREMSGKNSEITATKSGDTQI